MEPTLIFTGAQARQIIISETEFLQPRNFDFRNAILGAVAPTLGMSLKEGRLAINSGVNRILPKLAHRILVEYDVFKNGNKKKNPAYGAVFSGAIPMASFSGAVALPPMIAIYEMLSGQTQQNEGVTSECEAGIQAAVANVCSGGEGTVIPQCPGNLSIGANVEKDPYTNNTTTGIGFAGVGIPAGETECNPGAIDVIVNAIRASNSPAPENQGPTNNGTTAAETQPPIFQQQLYLFNMFPDLRPVLAPEFRMVCVSSKAIENVTAIKLDLPTINEVQAIIGVDPSTANGLHIIDTRNPDDNTRVKDILAGLNRALEGTFFNITDERAILRLQSKDFLLNFKAGELIVIDEKVIENILHYLECAQAQDGIQYVNRFGPVSAPTAITTPEREVTGFGTFLKLFKNLINNFLHGNGN